MDDRSGRKPYIDVIENVFGGVRISTPDERRTRPIEPDLRARPWLAGITVASTRVRLMRDDDPDRDR